MDLDVAATEFENLARQLEALYDQRSDLSDRRVEAENRAAVLRQDRIEATIGGVTFGQANELREAEDQISVIDEALAEIDRRIGAVRPDHDRVRKFKDIAAMKDLLDEAARIHVEHAERAQRLGRACLEEVAAMQANAAKMVSIRQRLGAHNGFDAARLNDRLGGRISRALTAVAPTGVLGQISWPIELVRAEDWAAEERVELAREIEGEVRHLVNQLRETA